MTERRPLTADDRKLISKVGNEVFQEWVEKDPLWEVEGSESHTAERDAEFAAEVRQRFEERRDELVFSSGES